MRPDHDARFDAATDSLGATHSGVFDGETMGRLRGLGRGLVRDASRTLGDLTADQPLPFIAMALLAGIFFGRGLRR